LDIHLKVQHTAASLQSFKPPCKEGRNTHTSPRGSLLRDNRMQEKYRY